VPLGVECGQCHLVLVQTLDDVRHLHTSQKARLLALSPRRKLKLCQIPVLLYLAELLLNLELLVSRLRYVNDVLLEL
jgi:hypothetical protein